MFLGSALRKATVELTTVSALVFGLSLVFGACMWQLGLGPIVAVVATIGALSLGYAVARFESGADTSVTADDRPDGRTSGVVLRRRDTDWRSRRVVRIVRGRRLDANS